MAAKAAATRQKRSSGILSCSSADEAARATWRRIAGRMGRHLSPWVYPTWRQNLQRTI